MSCHKYRHSNFKVHYRYVNTAREQCAGMIVAALLSFESVLFVGVTYCIVLVCFWTTVCKTVRPMLSVSCLSVCLSVLSCLRRSCTVAKRLDGSR